MFPLPRRRKQIRKQQMVVQRTLLPKSQVPSRQMVTIDMENKNASFLPVSANDFLLNSNKPVNSVQMIPVSRHHMNRTRLNIHNNAQTNMSRQAAAGQPRPIINTQLIPPANGHPRPITVQTANGQAVTLQPISQATGGPAVTLQPISQAGSARTVTLQPLSQAGSGQTVTLQPITVPLINTVPPTPPPHSPGLDMPLNFEACSPEKRKYMYSIFFPIFYLGRVRLSVG